MQRLISDPMVICSILMSNLWSVIVSNQIIDCFIQASHNKFTNITNNVGNYANVKIKWTWCMSHSFQNALYTWLKPSSACRDGVLNLSHSDSARFVIKYIVWRSLDCLWLLLKSGKVVSYWGCQPDQHQTSTYQSKPVWTSLEVHADLDWSFSRDNSRLLCRMQEFLDDSSSSTVVCIVYLLF